MVMSNLTGRTKAFIAKELANLHLARTLLHLAQGRMQREAWETYSLDPGYEESIDTIPSSIKIVQSCGQSASSLAANNMIITMGGGGGWGSGGGGGDFKPL